MAKQKRHTGKCLKWAKKKGPGGKRKCLDRAAK